MNGSPTVVTSSDCDRRQQTHSHLHSARVFELIVDLGGLRLSLWCSEMDFTENYFGLGTSSSTERSCRQQRRQRTCGRWSSRTYPDSSHETAADTPRSYVATPTRWPFARRGASTPLSWLPSVSHPLTCFSLILMRLSFRVTSHSAGLQMRVAS